MTPIESLLARVDLVGDCWKWMGPAHSGVGAVCVGHGKWKPAHRIAADHWHGPFGRTDQVVQTCGTPLCVNPDHLVVRRRGNLRVDMIERFLADVTIEPDLFCWVWVGETNRGKPRLRAVSGGCYRPARRVAFEFWRGPIPPGGWEVVLRCERRLCVNPDHMTLKAPGRIGWTDETYDRSTLVCGHGHWVLGDNALTVTVANGEVERKCRACRRERTAELLAAQPAPDPDEEYRDRFAAFKLARLLGVAS